MKIARKLVGYTGPGLVLQELLYGFIMALIFVSAAQFEIMHFSSNTDLILAIIGMNTAWGIVDMVIFSLVDRFDQREYVRIIESKEDVDDEYIKKLIHYNLSGTLIDVLDEKDEIRIVKEILRSRLEPEEDLKKERRSLYIGNFLCFVYTISTVIPVSIPLLLIEDMGTACLWSSLVSAAFMFLIGYLMHEYTGVNKWLMGLIVASIGMGITFLALILGG